MSSSECRIDYALNKAYEHSFKKPVTAYLTNAYIVACCCIGEIHRHVRADSSGWFAEWHRVRTSEIRQIYLDGKYWVVCTNSGSHYVLVTLHCQYGKTSLHDFMEHFLNGLFHSSNTCH